MEDGEVDTDVIRTSVVCAVDGIASPSHEDFGIVVVEGAMRVRLHGEHRGSQVLR